MRKKFNISKEWKIVIGLAILGSVIFSFNFQIYQVNISEHLDDNKRTINELLPAEISLLGFEGREATVTLYFENFTSGTVLVPEINGKAQNQIFPSSFHILRFGEGELQNNNVLTLKEVNKQGGQAIISRIKFEYVSFDHRIIYLMINLLSLGLVVVPSIWLIYKGFSYRRELEYLFPEFLRDIVENMKAGMSLPQSIKAVRDNSYGPLSQHINKISKQLDWGISFEDIMKQFAHTAKSQTIRRAVSTIIQAHQSGGKISEVLESVGSNMKEIIRLKKERKNEMYKEVMTGYVIYIVFLIVLIGVVRYLLPSLSFSGDIFSFQNNALSLKELVFEYSILFRNLALIQAVFSGLVIGRLSEGSFRAGGKHIITLGIIGYTLIALLA